MIGPWELVIGSFTLIFYLATFYFLSLAGTRYEGKRGVLYMTSALFLGSGYFFDMIGEAYNNRNIELLSHGAVIFSGILFLLSFYLSKKELEKEGSQE